MVKDINSKSLKLQLDIFHLQLLEGNLTNRIKELLPHTGMYSLCNLRHQIITRLSGYQVTFKFLKRHIVTHPIAKERSIIVTF